MLAEWKAKLGFVATPIVVMLSMLMVSVAILASVSSVNILSSTASLSDSLQALSYAESASRDLLRTFSTDPTYKGSDSPAYSYGMEFVTGTTGPSLCSTAGQKIIGCARIIIQPIGTSGETVDNPRIFTVTGYYKNVIRKIQFSAFFSTYTQLDYVTRTELKSLPTVVTANATSVTNAPQATLNGWTNANGNSVNTWFQYGVASSFTACTETSGNRAPATAGTYATKDAVLSGADLNLFHTLVTTGLSKNTDYNYCSIVSTGADCVVASCVYGNLVFFHVPS